MTNSDQHPARHGLLDELWRIQQAQRFISDADIHALADRYGLSGIEVEGVASFYHFLHRRPAGRFTIYLNDSIVSKHHGYAEVRAALEAATGARWGETDPTGTFGLYDTSCIGLTDQEPAALINFHPFTRLTAQKAKALVWQLRRGVPVEQLADPVPDQIRRIPPEERRVLLGPVERGRALQPLRKLASADVLEQIEQSGLRGMGGAFFPVGRKWSLCRQQPPGQKYIISNADEGEPGTFKDRVLLHSFPELMIEGMIIAGYCTGATRGIVYLRAEYHWLLDRLEAVLEDYRADGWLGSRLPTREPFEFDIRIQLGAGAYVCGEETALIRSLEGYRGEPTVRTWFPVTRGYQDRPTVVNNVETFAAAARILEQGADHFRALGTELISGTRLLSVGGDCTRPGIYEIEWGETLGQLLEWCGAEDAHIVQVSGPSGLCVRAGAPHRRFDLNDLRCGGALTIFNRQRELLGILHNFAQFFKTESCGVCTPCRAGNFIFTRKLEKLAKGLGTGDDYQEIRNWSRIMQQTSRCGLGRAATNALLSAMESFPEYFACYFEEDGDCRKHPFDLERALVDYREAVK